MKSDTEIHKQASVQIQVTDITTADGGGQGRPCYLFPLPGQSNFEFKEVQPLEIQKNITVFMSLHLKIAIDKS